MKKILSADALNALEQEMVAEQDDLFDLGALKKSRPCWAIRYGTLQSKW